jgi:hypothetical protein
VKKQITKEKEDVIGCKCLKNELGEVLVDAKNGKNAWRSF